MSQFEFLRTEWPDIADAAERAEVATFPDPRTGCFYARRALEMIVHWMYKRDSALKLPYQDNLSTLIHEPTYKSLVGDVLFTKMRLITKLGNQAVHSASPIASGDAVAALRELFHVGYWFARTYAQASPPPATLAFDVDTLPRTTPLPPQTRETLLRLEEELRARDETLSLLFADKAALDAELERLRAEVAAARAANSARPDTHDYSEQQTRDFYIDLLLKEAGWMLTQPRDREFEVDGMPNNTGKGYVDYVLWGDDDKPLAVIEAKRTKRDSRVGQQQAKLYADRLEARFGRRPLIFYTNGYQHWFWDDTNYPPRAVQGFYKKDELELAIQRRTTRKPLAAAPINQAIVERYYQTQAIRYVAESFERDNRRKALIVMATGAGKTRTVIALADLLIRSNWAKRVLFLADRVVLVKQAVNAFKRFLPDSSPVNLVSERDTEGRVYVSTYPTMMGIIDEMQNGQRRFGVGHFDLIVIDEAHRSVFQKYRAIFDYFDAHLVGLTATPKDEVDRNTYSLFDLQDKTPTYAYSLDEAINDGYLVPPRAVSVPLKFQREGIRYDELSEEEKDEWDALDWDEEGTVPDRVEAEAVNKWLFNEDTVDKVLLHLMTRGQRVAGGDRLGKTIIFAKNQAHAEYIAERFNANYPQYRGEFARVITFKTEYAQSLIDDFSAKDKAPHIAISVDMLDTGLDVPEVVNLVFFKLVRSKTKFWQMVGRGTRLCPDLYGPGQDKEFFYIFDYCRNLEFFSEDPTLSEGSLQESLAKRLFKSRLELLVNLDKRIAQEGGQLPPIAAVADSEEPHNESQVRSATASILQQEVAAMNVDNFVIRPKREFVEKYARADAWQTLSHEAVAELSNEVAGLPSTRELEAEEAKRFDLLVLNLQLALLNAEPGFERLRGQVIKLAGLLEERSAIPMINQQMPLIQDVQSDEWWQDVTVPMLEVMRKRLRLLIQLIEYQERRPIYTNFEDVMGGESDYNLPGFSGGDGYARFKKKAREFLQGRLDHIAIYKLRMNKPLTAVDLEQLDQMLRESGIGNGEMLERAKQETAGLGLFVRSLIGLDRSAAKEALALFLADKSLSANQITFVNMVVDHLTARGVMEPARLYESPFTDVAAAGPDGIFTGEQVDELVAVLEQVKASAVAA
ncbi:MAG: DEAD/DEAH box helicase family protein [Caldilineaceae bacterium]|nr:DEAD/DEAH box helicase family protein [Caldilineaceae bacterium]